MEIEGFAGVKFWLNRVGEEHMKLAQEKLKRYGNLFFQSTNFNKMRPEVREKVIAEMVKDMREFGWEDTIKEYFSEITQKPVPDIIYGSETERIEIMGEGE